MKTKRSRRKKIMVLPINTQHWWLSEYGSYSRSAAVDHAANQCEVEHTSVEAILDARTEFLAAMQMETPYASPDSHSYAQLRQLTEDFIDDALVEEGILRFPILADYVAQRTGLSMGLVLSVLAADARYTHECSGSSVVLGLAAWADPQIRAARAAFDAFQSISAHSRAGTAPDAHDLTASLEAARQVAASQTRPRVENNGAVDVPPPPIIRMQHLVLAANAKLADLEEMIGEHPTDLNSPDVLSDLAGMRNQLGDLFNQLWRVMMRKYALSWCEPNTPA